MGIPHSSLSFRAAQYGPPIPLAQAPTVPNTPAGATVGCRLATFPEIPLTRSTVPVTRQPAARRPRWRRGRRASCFFHECAAASPNMKPTTENASNTAGVTDGLRGRRRRRLPRVGLHVAGTEILGGAGRRPAPQTRHTLCGQCCAAALGVTIKGLLPVSPPRTGRLSRKTGRRLNANGNSREGSVI
jgi:hypothetical protein